MRTPLPGAEPISPELEQQLEQALRSQGPNYRPNTHHLAEDGSPRFVNRLVLESSPYLLQHAHNPVDWRAWGDEAFAEAKRLGRPLLLSVGYATCHWCHVMERESFEDEEIARFMNEHYVCIKVDREERPDVDAIYMSAVQQQLHGSGGWPMTVWLTPEQQPFFAGTYFPARDGDRGPHRGFLTLLGELHALYLRDPASIQQAALALTEAVRDDLGGVSGYAGGSALPSTAVLDSTSEFFKRSFDPVHGGLRRAPKFPSNVPARLLLRMHARKPDAQLLDVVTLSLEKMAAGGIYDHLAGGFHRYSVDERWLVPHFEKMLYDNALLAVTYAEAHQVTGRPDFARIAGETLNYLAREMTSPEGGFYSATDADSEGEEGRFFVWSESEIRSILGDDAERFIRYYGVSAAGNFEGRNILNTATPSEAEWAALAGSREKLYRERAKRPPPLRDDKILAAWNGLAISAFAIGGRVLLEERHLAQARQAASFVLEKMRPNGRLLRSVRDGRNGPEGFLDDYAFVAQGLLDLYEATFELRWLDEALTLAREVESHFADRERGGWFLSRDDQPALLAREKPNYDGAEPSGTSVQLLVCLRLAEFTSDESWSKAAERTLEAFAPSLAERPLALTEMMLSLDWARATPREILLVWPEGQTLPEAFATTLAKTFVPGRVMAGAAAGSSLAELARRVPWAAERNTSAGATTAYVCERGTCQLPTTDADVLRKQLTGKSWS